MFFAGTLQEGISTALQQSKLVACFVTDDQEESNKWETEYLKDESIASSLEKEAVVLRLTAGSEEAGYLAAIFPLPKIPALVIIKNGALKEYVSAGTEKDEFLKRVAAAFAGEQQQQQQPVAQGSQLGGIGAGVSPIVQTDTSAPAAAVADEPATVTSASSSAEHVSHEGERRRQAARQERERIEKEKAQRRKEKGKMPADGGGEGDPAKAKQSDSVKKASQQLAEKQRQAREDRARVLKRIADDKAERKAKEEMRKQEREAERAAAFSSSEININPAASNAQDTSAAAPSSSVQRRHDQCAIQVRLFDGSTIRTRLSAKATIRNDIRPWIDENRTDGKDPYTFKVILTPLPNRAIDHATEEDKTLQDLGLTPSSTLVLTPVDRYATAYTNMNAGLGNPVSRFVTAVLAFVVNILGGIAGALGGGSGGGGAAAPLVGRGDGDAGHELSSIQGQSTGRDGGGRIQGFQNPDDRRKDYQLYNGNSVSPSTNYHDNFVQGTHFTINANNFTVEL